MFKIKIRNKKTDNKTDKKIEKKPEKKQEQKIELDTNMRKIKVNMLDNQEIMSEFEIKHPCKSFEYNGKKYKVNDDKLYLKFIKKGYMPYLFYNINNPNPIDFKNRNKGIPSRALHLLWNTNMYKILFTPDQDRTNKLIIILLIANLVAFGIALFLKYRS